MDVTTARRVIELQKEGKKILVTLWQDDKISSCVEEDRLQRCESCEGNEELCEDYVSHLKEQGYEVREVELGELEVEESLPKFLEERRVKVESEEKE